MNYISHTKGGYEISQRSINDQDKIDLNKFGNF